MTHPRPLKRVEYDRLVALGAFEDERVELLHGVLVDMSPNDPEHVSPIDRLTMILVPALRGRAIVRIQLRRSRDLTRVCSPKWVHLSGRS